MPLQHSFFLLAITLYSLVSSQASIPRAFADGMPDNMSRHFVMDLHLDPHNPVLPLEKGHSIIIPITLLGTYSQSPENIQQESLTLGADVGAVDSGLEISIVPSNFEYPSQTNKTAILNISATKESHDGIYQLFVDQHGNSSNSYANLCGEYTNTVCPLIQVGNSSWDTQTLARDSHLGLGGNNPPDWLNVDLQTDKEIYHVGETVIVSCYLQNNGSSLIGLDPDGMRLVVVIGNNTISQPGAINTSISPLLTFDARPQYYSDNNSAHVPITLAAHSKMLLVRPFYWNQEIPPIQPLPGVASEAVKAAAPGTYRVQASFAGYNGTVIHAEKSFQILNSTAPVTNNVGNSTNSSQTESVPPTFSPADTTRAEQIAIADSRVQKLIAGRPYTFDGIGFSGNVDHVPVIWNPVVHINVANATSIAATVNLQRNQVTDVESNEFVGSIGGRGPTGADLGQPTQNWTIFLIIGGIGAAFVAGIIGVKKLSATKKRQTKRSP